MRRKKKRECLLCSRRFLSRGPENRRCQACSRRLRETPQAELAGVIEPVTLWHAGRGGWRDL
jgi:tRNA(Ile2) C34 agmatinyltransferase TiaS